MEFENASLEAMSWNENYMRFVNSRLSFPVSVMNQTFCFTRLSER